MELQEKNLDLEEALPRLLLKPQLRFLWQTATVTEEYLSLFTQKTGLPFAYGYDGVCLQENRNRPLAWWSLTVAETYCRLNFGGEEGLRAGLDFVLSRLEITSDGGLFLPLGTWKNTQEGL